MKIDNVRNQYNNNIQFGALKVKPALKEWNTDVLTATLSSRTIRNIISKDAANGKDTFMNLNTLNIKGKKGEPTQNRMSLIVKGADRELSFNAMTTVTEVSRGLFRGTETVIRGAKNLGQDIAEQIRQMDLETSSISKLTKEVKDLAGSIEEIH